MFHFSEAVGPLNGKAANKGTVTEAYAENAIRMTQQIPMEHKQCGFAPAH